MLMILSVLLLTSVLGGSSILESIAPSPGDSKPKSHPKNRAAAAVPNGAVRIAPLPNCGPVKEPLVTSPETEVARRLRRPGRRDLGVGRYDPRLGAGPNGEILLVWSDDASDLWEAPYSEVVVAEWRNGSWGERHTIAAGAGVKRINSEILVVADGSCVVVWFERDWSPGGSGVRLLGRRRTTDRWSEPLRVTDESLDNDYWRPALVEDRDGEVKVLWVANREQHWVPSLYHPIHQLTKVFMKPFGAPFEESAEQVTPHGRWAVAEMAPVRTWTRQPPEVVYWMDISLEGRTVVNNSEDLYVTRRNGSSWSKPTPLLNPSRGSRKEQVESVQAFRDSLQNLYVIYTGTFVGGRYSEAGFASELRILQRTTSGRSQITSLARGIGESWSSASPRASIGPDGVISIAYRPEVQEFRRGRWVGSGGERAPYYLVRSDGTRCLGSIRVSASSTRLPLFDVAVDSQGSTHIVWVQDEGPDAVLMHRVISSGGNISSGN